MLEYVKSYLKTFESKQLSGTRQSSCRALDQPTSTLLSS